MKHSWPTSALNLSFVPHTRTFLLTHRVIVTWTLEQPCVLVSLTCMTSEILTWTSIAILPRSSNLEKGYDCLYASGLSVIRNLVKSEFAQTGHVRTAQCADHESYSHFTHYWIYRFFSEIDSPSWRMLSSVLKLTASIKEWVEPIQLSHHIK